MTEEKDTLVRIDPKGSAHPLDQTAAVRLQARAGRYVLLPGPSHLIVLRRLEGDGGSDTRPCRLSGEIRNPGALCDIVGFLGHGGWKGELLVLEAGASRSIFFDQGHVAGAQSTVAAERLGEILHRYGVLSRDQVAACSEASLASGMRFGEAAVRLGFIPREKLFSYTARQIEEVFYGVLLVSAGMFYFLESYDDSALAVRQKLSVAQLVREGVRRMHETRFFRTRIPSDRHVPEQVQGMARPETDPIGAYALIDGRRSVADLCRELNQSEFEVSRLLFQMVQAGQITVKPPRLSPRESTDVYNQAVALVLRELDAMDEGDSVREQLAGFAAGRPVYGILFEGAGPADDGTLNADRVADNCRKLAGDEPHEEVVAKALYEYASYALFLARPYLRRAQEAQANQADDESRKKRLSQRVSAMLEPIAPAATNPGSGTKKP